MKRSLCSLRVSESSFNLWTDACVDLIAMLACRDKIDKELKAEKGKVSSLKDEVKSIFLLKSEFSLISYHS